MRVSHSTKTRRIVPAGGGLIQIGDQLDIKFFYNPTLNEQITVRPDGRILNSEVSILTSRDLITQVVTAMTVQVLYPDPEELARALLRLLQDPGAAIAMGQAGYEKVRRRYTWPRIAADTLRIYDRLTR